MRVRLNDRLERATRFPVTLIVAPAGFGKSIALRDFIQTARFDAVRYDVRREDDSLLAFARNLSEALGDIAPAARAAFAEMQGRVLGSADAERQVAGWFAEHLRRTVCSIVIDDLHFAAADAAAVRMLVTLIERTADRIKWILASRSDAGLPVASWIAYGRMDLPLSEDELRFTPAEALAAAQEAQADIDPAEIEALRLFTEGWPAALAIALRTRTYAADLRSASAGTREMVYRYLAEQVFTALSTEQRAFLLATSVFSTFDLRAAELLGASIEFLADLRRGVAFLNEPSPGEFRYHDLFRDYLESELRRQGEGPWTSALCTAAEILEQRGDDARALALYARARDAQAVLRIIARSGFTLFERGEVEILSVALSALPDMMRRENASSLGIAAMLEASRGHFHLAEHDFVAAIERAADPEMRAALVQRYAIELVRRKRDCIALLEPYARDGSARAVPILATLATAYADAGRYDDAGAAIARALSCMDASTRDDTRARVYQQAAYVYQYAPPREYARSYAALAIEIAEPLNLYEVAARAYAMLYELAYDEDEPIRCLSILDKVADCARKGASRQMDLFSTVASYEIEVDRGNDPQVERLDRVIEECRSLLPQGYSRALLPAQALRAAWERDFGRSYALLAPTIALEIEPERRAVRLSEIALYAFAAGLPAEGAGAAQEAVAALALCDPGSRRANRSRLFLAVAEMARGHAAAAHRHLTDAERLLPVSLRRLRALAAAVRAAYRVQLHQSDGSMLSGALERLRSEHFGGLARLLAALPFSSSEEQGYSLLTPAERDILQMLGKGASSKEIGRQTGRSSQTVDTHIRSICRKLHCSGRREAVALATSAGWVHAQASAPA
jgi:ATP/maltotriose-dependent transcriptional regulator MalT